MRRVGYLREVCWLHSLFAVFFVRKDLELMKKSQGGRENDKIIQRGYMVIITKTNPTIQKRTEETEGNI